MKGQWSNCNKIPGGSWGGGIWGGPVANFTQLLQNWSRLKKNNIKLYFTECVFSPIGWFRSVVDKYDNTPQNRWQQVPVLINYLLNYSYQMIRSKRLIQ